MKPLSVSRSAAAEYLRQDIDSKLEAERFLATMNEDSDDDMDEFIKNINKTVNSTKITEQNTKKYCFDEFIAPMVLLRYETLLYKNNSIIKPIVPPNCVVNCVFTDKVQLLIDCFDSLDGLKFALQYNLFSAWSCKTKLRIPDYVMTALYHNIFNIDNNNDIFNVISAICTKSQTEWTPSSIEFKNTMNNLRINDDIFSLQSLETKVETIECNIQNQEILTFFNLNFIKNWLLMISCIFGDNLSNRIGATTDNNELVQRLLSMLQSLLIISLDNSVHGNGETISACHIAISSILMRINQYIPSNTDVCACCTTSKTQELQTDSSTRNLALVLSFWNNIMSNKLLRLADLSYICSMLPLDINKYLVHDIYDFFLTRLIEEIGVTTAVTTKNLHNSILPMKIISIIRFFRNKIESDISKLDNCLLLHMYILLGVIDNIVKNCGDAWFKIPCVIDDEKMDSEDGDDENEDKNKDIFHQLKHECYDLRHLCNSFKNSKLLGYIDILEHTFKCTLKTQKQGTEHENSV